MKTTMKFFMSYMMVIALVVFASCKKDNLQDAVLSQNTVAENSTTPASGTNGTNGTNGSNGTDGEDGEDGADGADGQDGADGATGPQGPQGEQGPAGADGADGTNGTDGVDGTNGVDGADGATGPAGADGEDGNANVIASDWFGPIGSYSVVNGYGSYYEFKKIVGAFTADVLNSGTILVYAKFNNYVPQVWPSGHIAQLPLTISGGTTDHIFTFYAQANILRVRYRKEGTPASNFSQSSRFRYIIIPSSFSGKNAGKDFAKMSYEEVCAHLNIAE